jgi:hypothetical protein
MKKTYSDDRTFSGRIEDGCFSHTVFKGAAVFKDVVFENFADFRWVEFHGVVDFSGAVFKDGATFEGAKFIASGKDVSFKNAWFVSSRNKVIFKNASFGSPDTFGPRHIGDYKLAFSFPRFTSSDAHYIIRLTKECGDSEEYKRIREKFAETADGNLPVVLCNIAGRSAYKTLNTAFLQFKNKLQNVTFENCLFGSLQSEGLEDKDVEKLIEKVQTNGSTKDLEFIKDYSHTACKEGGQNEWSKSQLIRVLLRHLGEKELALLYTKNDADFYIDFSYSSFFNSGDVSFKNAIFSNNGAIAFNNAVFSNDTAVDFGNACFRNKLVAFNDANFSNGGDVSFFRASFSSHIVEVVMFGNVIFSNDGEVYFHEAIFSSNTSVLGIGGISFNSVIFKNSGGVWFNNTIFSLDGVVSFALASFSNYGNVFFENAIFSNKSAVIFDEAKFSNAGDVSFRDASFTNDMFITFSNICFCNSGDVSFLSANFSNIKGVYFLKAIWINGGSVTFSSSSFEGKKEVLFRESLFMCKGKVSYSAVKAPEREEFSFRKSHFSGTSEVSFNGSAFQNTVVEGGEITWIDEAKKKRTELVQQEGLYIRDILEKKLGKSFPRFVEERINELTIQKKHVVPKYTSVFDDDTPVSWKSLSIVSAQSLTFSSANLKCSNFDGMTLGFVRLNAPVWLTTDAIKIPKWRKSDKRNILYAEKEFFEKLSDKGADSEELKIIRNQYTLLKNNLERQGDYAQAGDFHYGEQEMRRLGFSKFWQIFSLTNFYRVCCGYGEKPGRACFYFIAMILAVTFTNLNIQIYGLAELNVISFDDSFGAMFIKTAAHAVSPYWRLFDEQNFTTINNSNFWYFPLLYIFKVFIYLQTILLILALRRKFKR